MLASQTMTNLSESTIQHPNPQSAELYDGPCLYCGGYAFTVTIASDGSVSRKNPYFCSGGCTIANASKEYEKHKNDSERIKTITFTSLNGEKQQANIVVSDLPSKILHTVTKM